MYIRHGSKDRDQHHKTKVEMHKNRYKREENATLWNRESWGLIILMKEKKQKKLSKKQKRSGGVRVENKKNITCQVIRRLLLPLFFLFCYAR